MLSSSRTALVFMGKISGCSPEQRDYFFFFAAFFAGFFAGFALAGAAFLASFGFAGAAFFAGAAGGFCLAVGGPGLWGLAAGAGLGGSVAGAGAVSGAPASAALGLRPRFFGASP